MKENYNELIQEYLFKDELKNGLEVIMMPRPDFHRQYAVFATRFGSIDNCFVNPESGEKVEVPDGIAHFLEHKLFEGEEEDTFSKFARLGASANAFTNYTTTAYLFSSTDHFQESLVNLIDFVQSPYFTDENVEKEKGIIAQELRMYEDDPNYQVSFNLLQGLYHNHPVRIDIGGNIESIKQIDKKTLYLCYNTFYHPVNMVLFITGNFKPEEMLKIIADNQTGKRFSARQKVKRIYPHEPAEINEDMLVKKMDVSQPLFRLGFKETALKAAGKELVKQELGTNMLLDILIGKGSSLYQKLYDDGLVDDDFYFHYTREPGYGYAAMGGKTVKPEILKEKIIAGLIGDGEKNIKQEDFLRVYKKYLGSYMESFNSFESLAFEFISNQFKGVDYFDLLEIIKEIEIDYLIERFHTIIKKELAVSSEIKSSF